MPVPADSSLFQRETDQPLAARLRPRTLDEYIGQGHILGPGRLLRRSIQADQLSSVIFYGPPGTGKTTLARVIANSTSARFVLINAVLGGVKDIREAVAEATRQLHAGRRTILFVDEVHRFNKAQQDALLPWVENGTVILIGATTENPYFEVNKALVSRSRIFQLKPLSEDELRAVTHQALADRDRGYGRLDVQIAEDALDHLVNVANGDARALLNALELAVSTTEPDADGVIGITREVAEESIQQRAVLYDKEGDAHFDTISAFIKSMRGSDPDAALYWLAKMVYAGEDPRFIFRRLIIFAGEDVGLADPRALEQVMAAAQAYDYVGMPEGRYHLAQAVLYLATAPKSNSTMAFFDALAVVQQEREAEVPNHLRDGSRDKDGFGHGEGYLYPHAYRDHWVAQQYLPESLQGKTFYQPGTQGFEHAIADEVARKREAQLAAMLDNEFSAPPEVLTNSPVDANRDRWLQRTVSQAGQRLAELRDALLERAQLQRHSLVLDVTAGSGLLTWESVRRTPEGQVWSLAQTPAEALALQQQAASLGVLDRPVILTGAALDAPALVAAAQPVAGETQQFDALLGRSLIVALEAGAAAAALAALRPLLLPGGRLVLAEPFAARSQRIYRLVEDTGLAADLLQRWAQAEEAIYLDSPAARFKWHPELLTRTLQEAGYTDIQVSPQEFTTRQRITAGMLDGWFPAATAAGTPPYGERLRSQLSTGEVTEVAELLRRRLTGREVPWTMTLLLVHAQQKED